MKFHKLMIEKFSGQRIDDVRYYIENYFFQINFQLSPLFGYFCNAQAVLSVMFNCVQREKRQKIIYRSEFFQPKTVTIEYFMLQEFTGRMHLHTRSAMMNNANLMICNCIF